MSPAKSGRKKATPKRATGAAKGFTPEEKAAMRERARELKAAAGEAEDERAVLAKIAQMSEPDRSLAKRVHAIIREKAPNLTPRLWYGMPAYAKDGNVLCWFQGAEKFKTRYGFIGFSDKAKLDEGRMWPISFALTELTTSDEAKLSALLKKAVG